MEHLLPPGTKAPIRAYYYECDQELKDRAMYKQLYSKILSARKAESNDTVPQHEQAAWWGHAMYSQNPGNLWHTLIRDFFFGIPGKILNADVSSDLVETGEDGAQYLTTSKLNGLLRDWEIRVNRMDGDGQAARLLVAKVVLGQAATILRHLSQVLFSTGTPETAGDDPAFLTHFAIVMIHQALVEACSAVLGLEVRAGNGYSLRGCLPLVYYSLEKNNWCPSTVWQLDAMSDVDEMVYAYWSGSVQTAKDHSRCTTFTCEANQMAETVMPGHILDGVCSNCAVVDVPIQDVLDIVDTDSIPLIRITKDDDFLCHLAVTAMDGQSPYVAISHVWADGLGSLTSNSIRMCRLLELSRHIEQLEQDFHLERLCLWADTLCVPMDSAHIGAREIQIGRMHEVYSCAWAVIIIDADFMTLEQNADFKEVGTRVRLSAWASRLWTYQEGASNVRLFILTNSGLIDLTMILDAAASLADEDILTTRMGAKLYSHMTFALGRWEAGIRISHDPWSTDENEIVFKETELNLRRRRDRIAQMLLYNIKARTTSRPDDEALVIASSLDLDTSRIIAAIPEERMMALIKTLPYPPANMIFTVGPRLCFPGFKWASKTFLRSQGGGCFTPPLAELVPFTIDQINKNEVAARPMCRLDADGRGLWTFNPAILLPRACFEEKHETSSDLAFEMLGKPYAIRGCADDVEDLEACRRATTRIKRLQSEGKRLVVLLAEFYPFNRHHNGVLVIFPYGNLHEKASDGVDDTHVVGQFVMLVQFVSWISKIAVKEMGLADADEVDTFVAAATQLEKDRMKREMREVGEIEGTHIQRTLLNEGERARPEDEGFVTPDDHHQTLSRFDDKGDLEKHLRSDQETEKYLSRVVREITMINPEKRKGMYSATWLEPRFWLVD